MKKIEYNFDNIFVDTTGRKGWDGISVVVYKIIDDRMVVIDMSDLITCNGDEPFSELRHKDSVFDYDKYYEFQYEIDKQSYIDNVKNYVENDSDFKSDLKFKIRTKNYIVLSDFLTFK